MWTSICEQWVGRALKFVQTLCQEHFSHGCKILQGAVPNSTSNDVFSQFKFSNGLSPITVQIHAVRVKLFVIRLTLKMLTETLTI